MHNSSTWTYLQVEELLSFYWYFLNYLFYPGVPNGRY